MTIATKVRLRFAKCDDLRLVSHHDVMRCLERMLRRASIPMAMSQGFNPRPKMTFALALGLGIQGLREVVDLELSEPRNVSELLDRLKAVAPPGFVWNDAQPLSADAPAPRPQSVEYRILIPTDRLLEAQTALESLLASSSWPMTRHREDRVLTYDLRPHLLEACLSNEGVLCFRLRVSNDGSARPEELLEALGLRNLLAGGAVLTRTEVDLDR
jgi:radical SAM-linked protein